MGITKRLRLPFAVKLVAPFLALLLILHSYQAFSADVKRQPPPKPDYNCAVFGHPWHATFQDLKGAALFVQVQSGKYIEAVKCHGREDECADKTGHPLSEPRAAYIRRITDDYNAYPPSLHYDNLVRVFSDAIEKQVQPYVIPTDCKRPPIAILEAKDLHSDSAKQQLRDVVILAVRLLIVDRIKPKTAVLSVNFYRVDEAHTEFGAQITSERLTAIPLDLPDEEIAARLTAFSKGFMVVTRENTER